MPYLGKQPATISAVAVDTTTGTFSGQVAAASLDISGNVDVDGVLETDAISIASTTITSTAAELNILDGVTANAAELNIMDGATLNTAELNILDGVTSNAAELNILDGVTANTSELNILDGVTATTAEINLIDGGATVGTTAIADGDGLIINDAGTMRVSTVQTLAAYLDDEITAMPNLVTTAATTVGALDSGSITSNFGNINIGSSTITTTGAVGTGALTVGGAFTSQGIDDNSSATAITVSEADKVLIGTTTTNWSGASTLLVKEASGDGGITIVSASTSNNGNIGFADTEGNDFANMRGLISYLHSDDAFRFMTANSERMRIDSSGRMMIGTTTEGYSSADDLTIATTGHTGITIRSSASHEGAIFFSDATSGTGEYAGYIQYIHSNDSLILASNASERMRIDSSGNLGLGTSSPDYNLQIEDTSSNISLALTSSTSGFSRVIFGDSGSATIGAVTYRNSDNSMAFEANGSERMRINSSGNVGIGTSSPASKMHLSGTQTVFLMERTGQSSGTGQFAMHMEGSNSNQITMVYDDGGKIVFGTASNPTNGAAFSEKMNLDSSGNLNIGATSFLVGSSLRNNNGMVARVDDNLNSRANIYFYAGVDHTGGLFCDFNTSSGGRIGSITRASSSSVAYNTSSDYRLKENVDYTFDATTRLKQLKPARFNWIADETNTLVDGFLAHEVSGIIPEAITGEKDATNEDGSIKPQGIDQSKLVPLLVKTIQELEARITTLEGA